MMSNIGARIHDVFGTAFNAAMGRPVDARMLLRAAYYAAKAEYIKAALLSSDDSEANAMLNLIDAGQVKLG